MKSYFQPILFFIVLTSLVTLSCGKGSSGGSITNATGTITLSGADTVSVGTSLIAGPIDINGATSSYPTYVTLVDPASSISGDGTPTIGSATSGYVLVITQSVPGAASEIKAVSMTIIQNGVEWDYACTNPASTFVDCGTGISIDTKSRSATLTNVVVENTDSADTLTLNGSITW